MRRLLSGILTVLVLAAAPAGAAQKLEGQVVCCEDCWAEADRSKVEYGTAKDLENAVPCVTGGDPTLLAVPDGDRFTLYRLDAGKYRPSGGNWLELIGSRVRVTGQIDAADRRVVVDAVDVLAPPAGAAASAVGTVVDLSLKDLTGAAQSLAAMRGRIVVLNFWATYCAPCRTEMPDLTAIQNRYAALGVQVIGATAETAEDKAKVLEFIKEAGINFPVWLGAGTADMRRFGLTGVLPGTVVLAKDGKVAKVFPGVVKQQDLQAQIDAMLAAAEAASRNDVEEQHGESERLESSEVSSVPS